MGSHGVGDMHTRMNATISSFSATPWGEWIKCERGKVEVAYLLKLAAEDFEASAVILGPERVGERQREREDRHGRCELVYVFKLCSSLCPKSVDTVLGHCRVPLDRPFFLALNGFLFTCLPMGHVSNRLYSTASKLAISAAHLNQFPPKEAIVRHAGKVIFDPQSWAALQPPPPSALSAFSHRIGLGSILDSPDTIRRACTHKSFLNLHAKYYPSSPAPPTNADLAALGNSLMGLFASEYLHASYPHLPTRVLKAAVSAHVGPLTCASVAQGMGATPLLRWHRQVRSSTVSNLIILTFHSQPSTPTSPPLLHSDALASIPRALTALVYQERSLSTARKFVHSFFLNRQVDLRTMLKFRDPKRALMETVAKFGRERPKSR